MPGPELASYQMVLLRHTAAGRAFDEGTRERIFREHLAYTLSMVAGGDQLAAGPVGDSPAEEEDICGLGFYQKESPWTRSAASSSRIRAFSRGCTASR
ncbi:MAG TPA: hypothetical protein VIK57_17085 [Streptosporangiaceae bacterium]